MTEEKPERKSGPSRRAIIGWTLGALGMLVVVALAWFVGAVVVPAWQAHAAIERCRSSEQASSTTAAEAIEQLGGPEAATRKLLVYVRLPKRFAPHRFNAGILLGACNSRERLVALLSHRHARVRSAAALALWELGDPASVPALVAALQDEDAEVRENAALALGCIKDARKVEPLIAALGDEDLNVSLAAQKALTWTGQAAVSQLINALKDKKAHRRVAVTLGLLKDPRAVDPLRAALQHDSEGVRECAALALSHFREPRVVASLAKALDNKDESYNVRMAAAQALGWIGVEPKVAVPALLRTLGDTKLGARWEVITALGRFGLQAQEAVPELQKLSDHKDDNVRQAAAKALKKIRGEKGE